MRAVVSSGYITYIVLGMKHVIKQEPISKKLSCCRSAQVTVVDASAFMGEMEGASSLGERGMATGPTDLRNIADLLIDQVWTCFTLYCSSCPISHKCFPCTFPGQGLGVSWCPIQGMETLFIGE